MTTTLKNTLLALLPLILMILHLNSMLVTAEDITRIHTPDFPEYLNSTSNETASITDYTEYFQILKEFFDMANNNLSLDELLKNPTTSNDLNKLINLMNEGGDLENAHKIEVLRNYSSLSPQELLQGISSDELKYLIQKTLENGSLNEEILKEISSMYLSGNISFDDYVKALYLLKSMSGGSELATKIDSLLMNTLLNSLADSSLRFLSSANADSRILESDVASDTLKSMLDFFSREPSANRGLIDTLENLLKNTNAALPSVPKTGFPQFSVGLPTLMNSFDIKSLAMPLSLALVLSGILAYLLVKRKSFTRILAQLPVARSRLLGSLDIRSEVIRVYWNSVELLKKKVPMFPNETHREYLDKVLENIPNIGVLFKHITEAYEKVRWGAQEEKLFIHDTRRAYEDLVRELNKV